MTAWQDQPPLSSKGMGAKPLSRRQARENERGDLTAEHFDLPLTSGEQPVFPAGPREGWDTEARRLAGDTQAQAGRRSQRTSEQPDSFDSITHGRPQAPTDDGQQFRRLPVPAVETSPAVGTNPAVPPGTATDTRSEFASNTPRTPSYAEGSSPTGRRSFTATAPEDGLQFGATATPSAPVEERQLSRRELRALEAARAPVVEKPDLFDLFPQTSTPAIPPLVEPEQPLRRSRDRQLSNEQDYTSAEAFAEVTALAAATALAPAQASAPPLQTQPAEVQPAQVQPQWVQPQWVQPAPVGFTPPVPTLALPELFTPEFAQPVPLQTALPQAPLAFETSNPFDFLATPATKASIFDPPAVEAAPLEAPLAEIVAEAPSPQATVAGEPPLWTPPTGHWSTQAMIDDDEQVQENTLTRNIGVTSGAITTNALVIPTLPADDMTRPLGSTGEILITGVIDLPRSFGSTGAVPTRYDHSDVDTLLEAGDREDAEANPDSAPVRAIRAVNTHTSTLGAMDTSKPTGISRLPLILGVVATTLAVGVVVLVVAAMVFGVFK